MLVYGHYGLNDGLFERTYSRSTLPALSKLSTSIIAALLHKNLFEQYFCQISSANLITQLLLKLISMSSPIMFTPNFIYEVNQQQEVALSGSISQAST